MAARGTRRTAQQSPRQDVRSIVDRLRREFFYWRAQIDGVHLFLPYGVARKKQLRTFDPRQFTRWCRGETNYPLVNALMHQLVRSGFMSNRGRQIAASSLIHDLGVDWRYGAAFFEKHLIDFDVASNYGNWQYIAGVGSDPRGGRRFNIDKQTKQKKTRKQPPSSSAHLIQNFLLDIQGDLRLCFTNRIQNNHNHACT